MSLDEKSKILCSLLLLYVQIEFYQNLLLPHKMFFFLKKKGSGTSAPSFISAWCLHDVNSVQMWSFLWPVFSCIRTECGYLHHKSQYSVRMQENTDQKKFRIWTHFTHCSEISLPTLYSIYWLNLVVWLTHFWSNVPI